MFFEHERVNNWPLWLRMALRLSALQIFECAALENPRRASKNKMAEAERGFESVGGKHWEVRQLRQKELASKEG